MRVVHWVGILALSGCVAGDPADEPGDGVGDDFATGKGDGAISEGSAEACAALGAANGATREELDGDAGLNATAADSIVEHRPFADLAALDAAPWIGPVALEHLVAYGESLSLTCAASPPGELRLRGSLFLFGGDRQDEYSTNGVAAYTVTMRSGSFLRFHAIGPGTGSNAVVDVFGPIASEAAIASAPHRMGPGAPDSPVDFLAPADGVYLVTFHGDDDDRGFFSIRLDFATEVTGGDGLEPLDPAIACDDDDDCPAASACGPNRAMVSIEAPTRVCNPSVPGRWQHGQCDEAGGTYRTITVTADEACAMVDFLNHAPFTAMSQLGMFRRFSYGDFRGEWHTLAQWARTKFEQSAITSWAVEAARTSAATWQDDGEAVEDTVASTFANRSNLSGKDVLIPAALVTVLAADGPNGEQCVELRDAADAPSFLLACECQSNPACEDLATWHVDVATLVGQRVWVEGTLHFTAGRWRLDSPTLQMSLN